MFTTSLAIVAYSNGREPFVQRQRNALLSTTVTLDVAVGVIVLLGALTLAVLIVSAALKSSHLANLHKFRLITLPPFITLVVIGAGQFGGIG